MLSLDRNNIGNARLGTLEKDLNLVGNDYYTALTIFFAGKLNPAISLAITHTRPTSPPFLLQAT